MSDRLLVTGRACGRVMPWACLAAVVTWASDAPRRSWRVACLVGGESVSSAQAECPLLRQASVEAYNERAPKGDHTAPAFSPLSSHIRAPKRFCLASRQGMIYAIVSA
jgi:hypothetical protein